VVNADGGREATVSQLDADPDTRIADSGGSEMRVADTGGSDMRDADARLNTQTDMGPEDVGPDMDAAESEASTGPNLITNGNFAMGSVYWDLYQQMGGSSSITTPTVTPPQPPQLCVTVPAGASVILGWTPTAGGIMLSPGASYTFSYSAMATPAVIVEAKVGHSYAPYTAEYDGFNTITGTLTAFTSPPFAAPTADAAETSAGIEFTIPETGTVTSAETVCFENVSLVQNY
jgi:hypothetical protein